MINFLRHVWDLSGFLQLSKRLVRFPIPQLSKSVLQFSQLFSTLSGFL